MIKSLFTITFLIVTTLNLQAQDEAFMADALQLTKLSSGIIEANMGKIYTMIPEKNMEAFKKDFEPVMEQYYIKIAKKSMKLYTHDDVKAMLKFYNSKIGKKSLEVQAVLSKDAMRMAQELQIQLMPFVQKYAQ